MLELGFITTNRTKLAHFKFLSRRTSLRIFGFREKTFHASYTEPRLANRKRLLAQSYESALEQWKKGGLSENDFFFIEDTSVIVDALSARREMPGVDVKYWMEKKTFKSLDKQLRQRGNNRRVKVRSDIVLHVPREIQLALKLKDPYMWFWGETTGTIVTEEHEFASNPVYPWLDNQSFNKWFVPDGENVPMGRLSPSRALTHDFRKKAFDELLRFFRNLHLAPRPRFSTARQDSLLDIGDIPPRFLVCGYSCAGKTTLADYLVERYGYMHFEASDFMRVVYHERLGNSPEVSLARFAASVLKREPEVVPEKILELLAKTDNVPFHARIPIRDGSRCRRDALGSCRDHSS